MKKNALLLGLIPFCGLMALTGCGPEIETTQVEYGTMTDDNHFLVFLENNVEILKMAVLETDTYFSLMPFFPTLTQVDGAIKYWEGDPEHTSYTFENQFPIFDSTDHIIEINSITKIIK